MCLKDKSRFIEVIEKLAVMDEEEFNKYRIGAVQYASEVVNDPKNIVDNLKLPMIYEPKHKIMYKKLTAEAVFLF